MIGFLFGPGRCRMLFSRPESGLGAIPRRVSVAGDLAPERPSGFLPRWGRRGMGSTRLFPDSDGARLSGLKESALHSDGR